MRCTYTQVYTAKAGLKMQKPNYKKLNECGQGWPDLHPHTLPQSLLSNVLAGTIVLREGVVQNLLQDHQEV